MVRYIVCANIGLKEIMQLARIKKLREKHIHTHIPRKQQQPQSQQY